jgi:BlaI family penicillinase repressor
MPRERAVMLTNHELRLMNVLWNRQRATVADIVGALEPPPLAYTTVMTTLGTLEDKGYVAHAKAGRAFVYRPLVERSDAATSLLDTLLERFFGSSPGVLALALLEDERLSHDDVAAIKRLLTRKKRPSS